MNKFGKEFNTLKYVIEKANKFLLFAHSRPDSDTIGSVLAMKEHLASLGKEVDIACPDPFPRHLEELTDERFEFPERLEIEKYEVIIACDSVERGFDNYFPKLKESQVTVLMDHHPDITLKGDVTIIDHRYSSVCEIVYEFFSFSGTKITREIANFLLLGILGDTGIFKNSNTTARVMEITSDLIRRGASAQKVVRIAFANKKISTLRLWGRAFNKAKINSQNGMIATVITGKDMQECNASAEDIAQVASILNTVPGTKFSLILSEREGGLVKGSLRSEEYKGVDVSQIARQLGGGGHKLASGFEMKGKIVEGEREWEVI